MRSGRALVLGPVALDLVSHRVTVDTREVSLTAVERELLRLLLRERGRCVPRRQLVVAMAAVGAGGDDLDMHMRRLRGAIEADGEVLVLTVGGVGYRLAV